MANFNRSYKLGEKEYSMLDSLVPLNLTEKLDDTFIKIADELLNEDYFDESQVFAFMEELTESLKAKVEMHIDRIIEKEEREEELKELRKKFLSLTQEEKQFIVGGKE